MEIKKGVIQLTRDKQVTQICDKLTQIWQENGIHLKGHISIRMSERGYYYYRDQYSSSDFESEAEEDARRRPSLEMYVRHRFKKMAQDIHNEVRVVQQALNLYDQRQKLIRSSLPIKMNQHLAEEAAELGKQEPQDHKRIREDFQPASARKEQQIEIEQRNISSSVVPSNDATLEAKQQEEEEEEEKAEISTVQPGDKFTWGLDQAEISSSSSMEAIQHRFLNMPNPEDKPPKKVSKGSVSYPLAQSFAPPSHAPSAVKQKYDDDRSRRSISRMATRLTSNQPSYLAPTFSSRIRNKETEKEIKKKRDRSFNLSAHEEIFPVPLHIAARVGVE